MADRLDVAGRLADGFTAVDHTQRYVWATSLLGYAEADLTLHARQVWDWYGTEDGLDLGVLDADCVAFDAAATTCAEAATAQRSQLATLRAAWSGDGAAAAADFLRRHCDTADQVAMTLRTAADALAGLRDSLWTAVDTKVAAVVLVDDRRLADRPAWLAAAETVCTGVGDQAAASELVNLQVKPFVDNDIRHDWLEAVQAAIGAVAEAYVSATDQLTGIVEPKFAIPGELGPSFVEPAPVSVVVPPAEIASAPVSSAPVSSAPAQVAVPAATPEMAGFGASPSGLAPTMAAAPAQSMEPLAAGASALPAAGLGQTGAAGTGFGEMLSGFADSLGGLLGSLTDSAGPLGADTGLGEPLGTDMEVPELGDLAPAEEEDGQDPEELDTEGNEEGEPEGCEPEGDEADADDNVSELTELEPAALEPEPAEAPVPTEAPAPVPVEPVPVEPVEPTAPPSPQAEPTGSPCEIPADELPHAGG